MSGAERETEEGGEKTKRRECDCRRCFSALYIRNGQNQDFLRIQHRREKGRYEEVFSLSELTQNGPKK